MREHDDFGYSTGLAPGVVAIASENAKVVRSGVNITIVRNTSRAGFCPVSFGRFESIPESRSFGDAKTQCGVLEFKFPSPGRNSNRTAERQCLCRRKRIAIGKDTFDEGVDLDTLLVGLQLALLVFALAGVRRVRRQVPISNSRSTSFSDMRSWDSSRHPTISGVGKP